jgi:hypothetical protein
VEGLSRFPGAKRPLQGRRGLTVGAAHIDVAVITPSSALAQIQNGTTNRFPRVTPV